MPVYFYHLDDGQPELDHEGIELSDLAEARRQAIDTLANTLRDGAGEAVLNGLPFTLWVTDGPGDTGTRLFSLRVSASLPSSELPFHPSEPSS